MGMGVPVTKKCAHPACVCQVEPEEEYCSDYCKGNVEKPGGDEDAPCQCGHSDCIVKQAQDRLDEREPGDR
jgi:hypothetical protein